ncbi:MAG: hypothetical protein L6V93_11775 [Clostridiales bacterium]|nr:MAG: hypothetical protein L6V93_11775 [Clostridiales bacterium]
MLDRARTCEKEQHEIISSMLEKKDFSRKSGANTRLMPTVLFLNSTNHAFVLLNAVSHFQLDIPTKRACQRCGKNIAVIRRKKSEFLVDDLKYWKSRNYRIMLFFCQVRTRQKP